MAKISGRQVELFAGVENPAGTLQSTTNKLFLLPHSGSTFKRMSDKQMDGDALGTISNYAEQHTTREYSSGDIEGFAYADSLGMWLTMLFGSVPTTTGTTTLTHTFTKANSTTGTAMSIYRNDGGNYKESVRGARLSSFELDLMTDSWARYRASIIGQAPETYTTPNAPAAGGDNVRKFRPNDITVKLAANQAGLATASAVKCKSCTFKYASDMAGYPILGTKGYGDILLSGYDVMVDLTLLFEDTTQRDLWLNDTARYLQIEATSAAIGATTPKLTLNIPRGKIQTWDETTSVDSYVEETFTFTAYPYNSSTTFNAELVNTTARTSYGG